MLPDANPFLALAVVLVAAVAFGRLIRRLGLPSVTGQILVGVALGPSALGVFDAGDIHALGPIADFALSLIAVTVGGHLQLKRLLNAKKRLSLQLLAEITVTPLLVFAAVSSLGGTDWMMGSLLATLAVSTAPATIVALVKETHSRGVFSKTLVATVALNNMACVALFVLAYTAARVELDPSLPADLLHLVTAPFRELVAAALIGGLVGLGLVASTRRVVRSDRLATASIVGLLATTGIAVYFGVSYLLSCMFLGVALANLSPAKDELGHGVFEDFEGAIYGAFFTLAGAKLDFGYLVPAGGLALLVVTARIAGKTLASTLAMTAAGATDRLRRWLGPALIPQAGLAVGLLLLVQSDPVMAPVKDLLLAVGLTVVTANEIIGPVLTRLALARSGEVGKDRARLIDFIREENITTDLRGETVEEAIEQLADLLIRSHHLSIDRKRLLQSVLDREREVSTCIGSGLAIPHGMLEAGDQMLGVMGISREGLPLETPDGDPVHCVVLLATPPSMRERHLEVLAALARAVGSDRNVRNQLFSARSPAHASDILHAEGAEDFNYFLEQEA